jgi:hypothetical protein
LPPKEKLFFKISLSKIFKTATAQPTKKQLDNYSKINVRPDFTTSTDRRPAYNSGLAKVAVQCFV